MHQQIAISSAPTAISPHSPPHKHRDEIEKLLIVLAESRQASISAETLRIYSLQLAKYQWPDLQAAISHLALRPRAEGETAFPDLGTVNGAVDFEARKRRSAEARSRREQLDAAEEQDRREHPENYVSVAELIGEVFKARKLPTQEKQRPHSLLCEHGHGVDLASLRPEDLRALADALEGKRA